MGSETLIFTRLLQYSGCLVLMGMPLFFLYSSSTSAGATLLQRLPWERGVVFGSAVLALIGALGWVMAETVVMSGESADAVNPAALWMILSQTRFGLACLIRMILLLVSLGVCVAVRQRNVRWWLQAMLGGAITLSFAWTGHGATEIGKSAGIHLAGDLLHLLAAAIWIGALVPLSVIGFRASRLGALEEAELLRFALKAFSRIGVWVVAVIVISGIINSIFLLDLAHPRASLSSPYGKMLLVKLVFFAGMLALAALHRYRTTPALDDALKLQRPLLSPLKAARSSLAIETLLAALVLAIVSILGTLAPPDVQANHLAYPHEPQSPT